MADVLMTELEAGLAEVRRSPADAGAVVWIVRRPGVDQREVVQRAELDPACGVVGDGWLERRPRRGADGRAEPDTQVTIMNARVIATIAGDGVLRGTGGSAEDPPSPRWALAGDQLYLDLDLSEANLPAGTRLAIGSAIVEVSPTPHLGCAKFKRRFGADALRFVNSPLGRSLRLRGLNAKVIDAGVVCVGDAARKL